MMTRRTFIGGTIASATMLANSTLAASGTDLTRLTLAEASALIRTGALSPTQLVEAYLSRIARLQGSVNAYITVTDQLALEQAQRLDTELAAGHWRGPLHGIPIALKDNIDTAGIRTTAASALLKDRIPNTDAEIYRRLREAGAILLGKLNMHEWAWGGTSAITHFGPVHNPWNLAHIPGGSSGGSAAAVSARLCCAALGTDTLASIRLPAAYCGVVGLKATHGLNSIRGIIPVAESLDHVGPLCRTVTDSALMLQAMAGFDPLDPVSIDARIPAYVDALYQSPTGLRIGIARTPFYDRLDPDIATAVDEALVVLGTLTAVVREVSLPPPPDFSVLLAESYAYHEQYLAEPANHRLYDPVTLERILAAGQVKMPDYVRVRQELALVRHAIAKVFTDVDVLITPTAPGLPELISEAENPAVASGAESSVRNTFPFNLYGIPTLSMPCGFSRSGLPIGMQLSSAHLSEPALFTLAQAYEQATAWHRREPPLA
ncbi:MAG: amidase [Pseudomonadales bacterium]|nr:amidase [Pseudomonadales bacterium]